MKRGGSVRRPVHLRLRSFLVFSRPLTDGHTPFIAFSALWSSHCEHTVSAAATLFVIHRRDRQEARVFTTSRKGHLRQFSGRNTLIIWQHKKMLPVEFWVNFQKFIVGHQYVASERWTKSVREQRELSLDMRNAPLKPRQSHINLIKVSSSIRKSSISNFCSLGLKEQAWPGRAVILLTDSREIKLVWRNIVDDQQSHWPDAQQQIIQLSASDGCRCILCRRNTSCRRLNSDLDSPKPAQFLLTNAADKRPSRWSRSTRTNHTDMAAKAIELCFVISTQLLFKAAGRQLILIIVDGAGRTTTNQHVYSREWVYVPLSLSLLWKVFTAERPLHPR